jgi:hypothetical protein
MSAEPGDVLCALMGCDWVMTLRPVAASPGRYCVIGITYLDRFMGGEGSSGPLPAGYRAVWKVDD